MKTLRVRFGTPVRLRQGRKARTYFYLEPTDDPDQYRPGERVKLIDDRMGDIYRAKIIGPSPRGDIVKVEVSKRLGQESAKEARIQWRGKFSHRDKFITGKVSGKSSLRFGIGKQIGQFHPFVVVNMGGKRDRITLGSYPSLDKAKSAVNSWLKNYTRESVQETNLRFKGRSVPGQSKNHLFVFKGYEYFMNDSGEFFRAKIANSYIGTNGYRSTGRFLSRNTGAAYDMFIQMGVPSSLLSKVSTGTPDTQRRLI